MIFADTHAHLYLDEFDQDRDAMVARSLNENVRYMFLPNIDSTSVERLLSLCRAFPQNCFPMMGLHPTSVKENYRQELAIVKTHLDNPAEKYLAVGEIGIDFYWDKTHEKEQVEAFQFQLDLAAEHDLPVVIHTRNSFAIAAGILEERNDPRIRGIFHCFSGNVQQASTAIEIGFFLGIGGVVTYRNSGLQKVVETMPFESLVLETDAPFLSPVPYRGKRNESSYIPLIAEKIAELKKCSLQKVSEVTTQNALKLFNIRDDYEK